MKIQVLKKANTARRDGEYCPWLLEVPPMAPKK